MKPIKREDTQKVVLTSEALVADLNSRLGTQRSANKSVRRAVALLLANGRTPEQIQKVAVHRAIVEEWFDPRKHGFESLIRDTAFDSALERAIDPPKVTHAYEIETDDPEMSDEELEESRLAYLRATNKEATA